VLGLIQRVLRASVRIDNEIAGAIGPGFLLLLCAQPGDTPAQADALLAKVLKLRVFSDKAGKMNLALPDMDGNGTPGGLLVVSQFTLAADVSGGNRPSFQGAAGPELARSLYDHFLVRARALHPIVQSGRFGADMQVELINDGPVTIPLRIVPPDAAAYS